MLVLCVLVLCVLVLCVLVLCVLGVGGGWWVLGGGVVVGFGPSGSPLAPDLLALDHPTPDPPTPDPLRWTSKISLFFFFPLLLSPATVSPFLCLSLGVFSWNFGVFDGQSPQMCMFELTDCRVKSRVLVCVVCVLCVSWFGVC